MKKNVQFNEIKLSAKMNYNVFMLNEIIEISAFEKTNINLYIAIATIEIYD